MKVITLDTDGDLQEIDRFWLMTPEAMVLLAFRFRYPFAVIVREAKQR